MPEAGQPSRVRKSPSWLRIAAVAVVVGAAVGVGATQLPWPDGSMLGPGGSPWSGADAGVGTAAGDECEWIEVGEQVVGSDGTLTCERTKTGGYRWAPKSN